MTKLQNFLFINAVVLGSILSNTAIAAGGAAAGAGAAAVDADAPVRSPFLSSIAVPPAFENEVQAKAAFEALGEYVSFAGFGSSFLKNAEGYERLGKINERDHEQQKAENKFAEAPYPLDARDKAILKICKDAARPAIFRGTINDVEPFLKVPYPHIKDSEIALWILFEHLFYRHLVGNPLGLAKPVVIGYDYIAAFTDNIRPTIAAYHADHPAPAAEIIVVLDAIED